MRHVREIVPLEVLKANPAEELLRVEIRHSAGSYSKARAMERNT